MSRGTISFNLVAISAFLHNISPFEAEAFCVRIVVHELSHLDQAIDYNRFMVDKKYEGWIERTNENRSIMFLFENINLIHNCIGEYSYKEGYESIYQSIKAHGTGFVPTTLANSTMMVVRKYMLPRTASMNFNVITLSIYDSTNNKNIARFVVKQDNKYIDPNKIFPILYWLDKYAFIQLTNKTPADGLLNIAISVADEHRRLDTIVYKTKTAYSQDSI